MGPRLRKAPERHTRILSVRELMRPFGPASHRTGREDGQTVNAR